MPYAAVAIYNKFQTKPINLTKESRNLFRQDQDSFSRDGLGFESAFSITLPYTYGIRFPAPRTAYEFETELEIEKFFPAMASQVGLLISENLKTEIETIEPNTHQYFAVRISASDGKSPEERYFILNVCNQLKSINFGQSNLLKEEVEKDRRPNVKGREYIFYPKSRVAKVDPPYNIYINSNVSGEHAIWFEHGNSNEAEFYFSEGLYDVLIKLGGLGPIEIENKIGEIG